MLLRVFWVSPLENPQTTASGPQGCPQGCLSSSLLKLWSSNHSTHPKFPGTCQTAGHLQAKADMTRGRALSSHRTCPVENILHGLYPAGLFFTFTHLCLCASPSSVCTQGYSAHSLPPAGHLPGLRAWPLPSSAHT